MLLFNTNRSNKGKKYTRKSEVDTLFAEAAEQFNTWFTDNHRPIIYYLTDRHYFDDDVFNDCYLRIYESILYSGLKVENYRSYFMRSYFTILQDSRVKQNRYCEILPAHEKQDIETAYFAELEEKQNRLEYDIMKYIYANYDIRDFELFKMYISLKPAVNYTSLAEITGLKPHNIQRTISRIKKDIRHHRQFARRRREIV